MANTFTEVRKDIERRLRELEPLVKEHADLKKVLDSLGRQTAPARRAAARKSPGRAATNGAGGRTRTSAPASTDGRRGRPPGSGARAQQALKLVQRHPGITIAEMAKRMKIAPNYLYRVLPQLENDGHVQKRDKGYHAAGNDGPSAGE